MTGIIGRQNLVLKYGEMTVLLYYQPAQPPRRSFVA
jgi:hypothetical protein